MMKKVQLYIILGLICFFVVSCGNKCNCPETIRIHDSFKSEINEGDYCRLINKSINGDSLAFKQLIELPIKGGLMLDHSTYMCELIRLIGKEKICSWISAGIIENNLLSQVLDFNSYHSFSRDEIEKYFTSDSKFNCDSFSYYSDIVKLRVE